MTHVWGRARPRLQGVVSMEVAGIKVASWRTTGWGLLSLVLIAGKAVAVPWLDDDPATVPNFQELFQAFVDWAPVIALGLGLMTARDNVVSSHDVGIRQAPKLVADAIQRSKAQ